LTVLLFTAEQDSLVTEFSGEAVKGKHMKYITHQCFFLLKTRISNKKATKHKTVSTEEQF